MDRALPRLIISQRSPERHARGQCPPQAQIASSREVPSHRLIPTRRGEMSAPAARFSTPARAGGNNPMCTPRAFRAMRVIAGGDRTLTAIRPALGAVASLVFFGLGPMATAQPIVPTDGQV